MLFIVKGKEQAFNELYHRYAKKMLYFFYTKLYQDQEKANDFVQNLFLKIIESPEKFDTNQKFSTWVYTMAYNMCKNEYRKNETTQIFKEEHKIIPEEGVITSLTKHDIDYFKEQLMLQLNKLGENHKETFILRYQQELSIKEISELMNCAEGTVKSRLFYATKTLAKQLKEFKTYF